jgi:hypothetical protein
MHDDIDSGSSQAKRLAISFIKNFAKPDWSHSRYHSLSFLAGLILIYFVMAHYYPEIMRTKFGFYSILFVAGLIPSCILIILITENQLFRTFTKPLWIRFAFAVMLYFYFTCAYSWSESIVNETFKLDPKLFPNTTRLLVLEYFQFTILYPIALLGELFIIFLGSIIFAIKILTIEGVKNKIGFTAISAFIVLAIIFTKASIGSFDKNKQSIITRVAVDFDFNDNEICMTEKKQIDNRIGTLRINDSIILEAYRYEHFNYSIKPAICVK